jgi:opacity protein-like surface antigen
MKRNLLFLILVFCSCHAFAQNASEKPHRFSFGIYGSTPIYLTGTDKFFNDNWVLKEGNASIAQKREYYKYGYGITLQYFLDKNLSVRGVFGLSNRYLTEHYYSESQTGEDTLKKDFRDFKYHQTSFSALVGLNYACRIQKFVINSGLELSYLRTGEGKQTHINWVSVNSPTVMSDSTYVKDKGSSTPGNSFGLGIYLGAEYNFGDHISLGVEFHQFGFYTVFKGETTDDIHTYTYTNHPPDRITSDVTVSTAHSDNFRQFCFSTVVPFVILKYHLNPGHID